MNETLEEIAKTLFKSWFIDFDPVRAKAEGRSTGLSKEISDLFPDSFEDFELSEIPKGLRAGSLGDIIFRSKDRIGKMESKVLAAVSSGELIPSEEYFSKKVYKQTDCKRFRTSAMQIILYENINDLSNKINFYKTCVFQVWPNRAILRGSKAVRPRMVLTLFWTGFNGF